MKLAVCLSTLIFGCHTFVLAQYPFPADLARELSEAKTRRLAIDQIVASPATSLPLLLSWVNDPPPGVPARGLVIGLADAFGRLKAKEAIPFLVEHIGLKRYLEVLEWVPDEEEMERRLPAAAALIRIGPEALDPLIQAAWQISDWQARRALFFLLARIASPERRDSLETIRGQLQAEMHWVEKALRRTQELP